MAILFVYLFFLDFFFFFLGLNGNVFATLFVDWNNWYTSFHLPLKFSRASDSSWTLGAGHGLIKSRTVWFSGIDPCKQYARLMIMSQYWLSYSWLCFSFLSTYPYTVFKATVRFSFFVLSSVRGTQECKAKFLRNENRWNGIYSLFIMYDRIKNGITCSTSPLRWLYNKCRYGRKTKLADFFFFFYLSNWLTLINTFLGFAEKNKKKNWNKKIVFG